MFPHEGSGVYKVVDRLLFGNDSQGGARFRSGGDRKRGCGVWTTLFHVMCCFLAIKDTAAAWILFWSLLLRLGSFFNFTSKPFLYFDWSEKHLVLVPTFPSTNLSLCIADDFHQLQQQQINNRSDDDHRYRFILLVNDSTVKNCKDEWTSFCLLLGSLTPCWCCPIWYSFTWWNRKNDHSCVPCLSLLNSGSSI